MNTRAIMKIAIAVILMVTVSLSIPSTLAKYTDKKSYQIVVSSEISNTAYKNKATNVGAGTPASVSFTTTKSGYYAIIARGGDGTPGMYGSSLNTNVSYGGKGGWVYACVYVPKNVTITAYVGNRGKDPSNAKNIAFGLTSIEEKEKVIGIGGTNGLNCTGANGYFLPSMMNSRSTGAAGGAGTCVVANNVALLIAGGGGGGGTGDSQSGSVLAAKGGHGGDGGNISSSVNKDGNSYVVFSGQNGDGDGNRYGKGGSVKAGAGGDAGGSTGSDGTKISGLTGGNGGAVGIFGGGGGGGYAGGGGGAGDGAATSAGGGGGGSSAVILSNSGKESLKLNDTALAKIFELAGYSSDFSSYTGGFAIVAYLNDGVNTSLYSAGSF